MLDNLETLVLEKLCSGIQKLHHGGSNNNIENIGCKSESDMIEAAEY